LLEKIVDRSEDKNITPIDMYKRFTETKTESCLIFLITSPRKRSIVTKNTIKTLNKPSENHEIGTNRIGIIAAHANNIAFEIKLRFNVFINNK
jgi:hypothetical protein